MYSVRNSNYLLMGICLITLQFKLTSAAFSFDDISRTDDQINLTDAEIKENFDATYYYYYVLYSQVEGKIKELENIIKKLLDDFQEHLKSRGRSLSYIQKLFHSKALHWLSNEATKTNMTWLKDKVEAVRQEAAKLGPEETNVIEDYLKDLLPDSVRGKLEIDDPMNVNSIKDLKGLITEYDNTIQTFLTISKSSGTSSITNDTNDRYLFLSSIYEEILEESDEQKFKDKFTYERSRMLMYMDYGTEAKKQGFPSIESVITTNIDICDERDLSESIIHRLRCILLFYYKVLNEKFWETITPEDDTYEVISESDNHGFENLSRNIAYYTEAFKLLNFLKGDDSRKNLRFQSMMSLFNCILREVDKRMVFVKFYLSDPKTKESIMLYYDLLEWLKGQLLKVNSRDRLYSKTRPIYNFDILLILIWVWYHIAIEYHTEDKEEIQNIITYVEKIQKREDNENESTKNDLRKIEQDVQCNRKPEYEETSLERQQNTSNGSVTTDNQSSPATDSVDQQSGDLDSNDK